MGVKLRERPGKGWYVLIDWKGRRRAKCFGRNKVQAKVFADKLVARLRWAEQSGEPVALTRRRIRKTRLVEVLGHDPWQGVSQAGPQ